MFSTYNEGKSVVAERFIRTLKNKIFKHMTAVSKNAHVDKSDDIVNEYNNTHHRTIKKKPFEFKVLILLEYQNTKPVLLKDMLQIGLKMFLWLKKLKIMFHGHILLMINDLNGEKIIGTFYEKGLQKTINKDLG